jgi:DNA-binding NarL/FixJ family response regulator
MARTRILIADDHEIFRKGLRLLLESRPDVEICGEAANGSEALEATKRLLPEIVIMDISMPYVNGLDATRQIREQIPQVRILILSQHDSSYMLNAAMEAGAAAYVTKSQVARYLLAALDSVMRGETFGWTIKGFTSSESGEGELKKSSGQGKS